MTPPGFVRGAGAFLRSSPSAARPRGWRGDGGLAAWRRNGCGMDKVFPSGQAAWGLNGICLLWGCWRGHGSEVEWVRGFSCCISLFSQEGRSSLQFCRPHGEGTSHCEAFCSRFYVYIYVRLQGFSSKLNATPNVCKPGGTYTITELTVDVRLCLHWCDVRFVITCRNGEFGAGWAWWRRRRPNWGVQTQWSLFLPWCRACCVGSTPAQADCGGTGMIVRFVDDCGLGGADICAWSRDI